MNAIDTNVFVYMLDVDEPEKQSVAVDLVRTLNRSETVTVLPWQVAVECLNVIRRWIRQGKIDPSDEAVYLTRVTALFPLSFPTPSVLDKSLELTRRFSVSHWDSLLLAACIESRVTTLYSEDLASGMTYESVTVVNPFAEPL